MKRGRARGRTLTFLAAIYELTSVHTLSSDEEFLVDFVFVGVSEVNLSEGSTTTRIMQNFLHNTLDITLTLSEIDGTVFGGSHPRAGVGSEYATLTLSLRSDHSTHCVCFLPPSAKVCWGGGR